MTREVEGILLGIDTCGNTGSIALARVNRDAADLLCETEISGGEFAASLVPGIADLLITAGLAMGDLAAIVAVHGPGSFTGIRVGLAAVKALAEATGLPVITVSRLELLACVAQTECAALDAYRGQVFLGFYAEGQAGREMLVTAGEFAAQGQLPGIVAFCEEGVAHLLETVATDVELKRSRAPRAFDAIQFAIGRWHAQQFADVAALDGHYLRGADAKVSAKLS